MKIAVLGGCGIQGRTAVYDLARSTQVDEVICADVNLNNLDLIKDFIDMSKVRTVELNVSQHQSLVDILSQVDAAIDLLPRPMLYEVAQAAIEAGTGLVNTNYAMPIRELDEAARRAGVVIMPECGLDPGIDLILYGHANDVFDELTVINSYCGGFPERSACDNPLNYKISWTWEGVLASTNRPGRLIKAGRMIDVSAEKQHDKDLGHKIEFPGLGTLEAIPNGDAVFFTDLLGVTETIKETGRYTLRWPGWSDFWRPLKKFGFLGNDSIEGLPNGLTPIAFLDKLMGPQMQYRRDEKDLVVMHNVFEGLSRGRRVRLTNRLLIEREIKTGLMAMSLGVGYPASIVAQMIARGDIAQKGVLSPVIDIPYQSFIDALARRGIIVEEEIEEI